VRIAGDVQLAAEVQWLIDHVRWDLEEDLSRLIGDAPAHALGRALRSLADAVRRFAGTGATPAPSVAPAPPPVAGMPMPPSGNAQDGA
jgi:ubiquinone biosynthesis protein UbiJ